MKHYLSVCARFAEAFAWIARLPYHDPEQRSTPTNDQGKLSVVVERNRTVAIFLVTGKMDGTNVRQFEQAAQEQIDTGSRILIFDFKHLHYISSAGLRALLMIARVIKDHDGKALFCELSDAIADMFDISGFNEVLDVRSTKAEALKVIE